MPMHAGGSWWQECVTTRAGDRRATGWRLACRDSRRTWSTSRRPRTWAGPAARRCVSRLRATFGFSRLLLQPQLEFDVYGEDDPETGVGSGLSEAEAGLRLRYEIRRELAPYLGVTWQRRFGDTADFARAAGERDSDTLLVAGLRVWF